MQAHSAQHRNAVVLSCQDVFHVALEVPIREAATERVRRLERDGDRRPSWRTDRESGRRATPKGELDVGCGRGRALNLLATWFPNSRFVGIDLSEEAIKFARLEAEQRGKSSMATKISAVFNPWWE